MEGRQFIDISKLLHCGVYALLWRGEVVYVGKSKRPLVRLYSHLRNRGRVLQKGQSGPQVHGKGIGFDGVWFAPCMLGQLDVLEVHLIRKYLPKFNTKDKPTIPIPEEIKALLAQMVSITGLPPEGDVVPTLYMRRML